MMLKLHFIAPQGKGRGEIWWKDGCYGGNSYGWVMLFAGITLSAVLNSKVVFKRLLYLN